MSLLPFNIPTFTTGLEKDLESYLIPDDASPFIQNAYYFRKRILRRRGNTLIGRIEEDYLNNNANVLLAGNITYSDSLPAYPYGPFQNSITIEIIDTGPPLAVIHTFTDD